MATDVEGYSSRTGPPTVTIEIPVDTDIVLLDGDRPVTELTVPDQGTYVLDAATGTIVFTPVAGFLGRPTPVTFRLTDAYGQSASAEFTPVVLPAAPEGPDLTSTGSAGGVQSVSVVVPDGGSVRLLNADLVEVVTLTVPGEGTYTADSATGTITFVPVDGFLGTATPVSYRVLDVYGRSAIGTYTPTVQAAPATSTATTTTPPTTSTTTSTTAAVIPTSSASPTTPALAYTGIQVGNALAVVLLLMTGGSGLLVVTRRPRGRAH